MGTRATKLCVYLCIRSWYSRPSRHARPRAHEGEEEEEEEEVPPPPPSRDALALGRDKHWVQMEGRDRGSMTRRVRSWLSKLSH